MQTAKVGVTFSSETQSFDGSSDTLSTEDQLANDVNERARIDYQKRNRRASVITMPMVSEREASIATSATSTSTLELIRLPVWRVRILYFVAIGIIAALTVTALITIQIGINQISSSGSTINQAGRQRYISQLLAKDALKMYFFSGNASAMIDLALDMETNLASWNASQYALEANQYLNDATTQALFASMATEFYAIYWSVYHMYSDVLNGNSNFTSEMYGNLTVILANEGNFLTKMNLVVNEFAVLSDNKSLLISVQEYIFECIVLLVLVVEGLFIYWPLDIRVRRLIAKLTFERERLQVLNTDLENERNRAEELLLNILPPTIARTLTDHPDIPVCDLAEEKDVSVLFTDIVGFTTYSSNKAPSEVVSMLDSIFTEFDKICARLRCDKIKTIGDAYMMAAGLSQPMENHALTICKAALELVEVSALERFGVQIRVGVASGPVVAGIVGRLKFAYDVWGDTVNTASRMESNGQPGRVHIALSTKRLVEQYFKMSPPRNVDIKGKGIMRTYFIESLLPYAMKPSVSIDDMQELTEQEPYNAESAEAESAEAKSVSIKKEHTRVPSIQVAESSSEQLLNLVQPDPSSGLQPDPNVSSDAVPKSSLKLKRNNSGGLVERSIRFGMENGLYRDVRRGSVAVTSFKQPIRPSSSARRGSLAPSALTSIERLNLVNPTVAQLFGTRHTSEKDKLQEDALTSVVVVPNSEISQPDASFKGSLQGSLFNERKSDTLSSVKSYRSQEDSAYVNPRLQQLAGVLRNGQSLPQLSESQLSQSSNRAISLNSVRMPDRTQLPPVPKPPKKRITKIYSDSAATDSYSSLPNAETGSDSSSSPLHSTNDVKPKKTRRKSSVSPDAVITNGDHVSQPAQHALTNGTHQEPEAKTPSSTNGTSNANDAPRRPRKVKAKKSDGDNADAYELDQRRRSSDSGGKLKQLQRISELSTDAELGEQ